MVDKPENKLIDPHAHKIPKNKLVKHKKFILTKYKLSVNLGGYNAGSIITLRVGKKSGIPKERYWRRRLHDAEIDNCMVKIVKKPKEK